MFLEILKATVTLFIIIDPFLSMSMFLTLTQGRGKKEIAQQAGVAVYVAGGLLLLFLLAGTFLLDVLSITFSSFQIGGGIILLLLGIRTVLGASFDNPYSSKVSVVIIGTPMLSGAGSLTTIIIVSANYGVWIAAIACAIVLLATWLILLFSSNIQRLIGKRVIEVFSRVMGLLLTAIAVEYVVAGIKGLVS